MFILLLAGVPGVARENSILHPWHIKKLKLDYVRWNTVLLQICLIHDVLVFASGANTYKILPSSKSWTVLMDIADVWTQMAYQ